MLKLLTALVAGLVFGLGLILSGMANPEKVLGFLDLAGAWDPSLALVMMGAIGVGLPGFQWLMRRQLLADTSTDPSANTSASLPVTGCGVDLPTTTAIDRRLVCGSLAFGVGWGLVGFCPGPALVALGSGQIQALIFVAAMAAGMGLFSWIDRR
jgi:uncharacterized membrane protein YedE/YeeE